MKFVGCMVTGNTVSMEHATAPDSNVITVMQNGKVIGVVSEAAQDAVETLRMTFTRDKPKGTFIPLQGVAVQYFRTVHPDDAA